jgi:dihydrolipoamide dehydrogenase
MALLDIKVPDIGDFKDVPVIEIHVKPGDSIEPEAPLITLESDKATMEVPAPQAGKVSELLIKIGDKVSQGTPILKLDGGAAAAAAPSLQEAAAHTVASSRRSRCRIVSLARPLRAAARRFRRRPCEPVRADGRP